MNTKKLRNKEVLIEQYTPKSYEPRPYTHKNEGSMFESNKLPLEYDVLKEFWFYREKDMKKSNFKIGEIVANHVMDIWSKCKLLTTSKKGIVQRILKLKEKFDKQTRKEGFDTRQFEKLFQICSCPLNQLSDSLATFLTDQSTVRELNISFFDTLEDNDSGIQSLMEISDGAGLNSSVEVSILENIATESETNEDEEGEIEQDFCDEVIDFQSEPSASTPSTSHLPSKKNFTKIPTIAMVAERRNLTTEATADLVNATLYDYGVVTSEDQSLAVDASKVRTKMITIK